MAKYYTNGSSALAPKDPRKKFQVISGGKDNSASRPNFQAINGGKAQQVAKPKPSAGMNVLINSEKHAIGHNYGRPSFYSGSGKTTGPNNKGGKTKFLGSKKTLGAMLIIMCLIGGGGMFLSSSHSLLGPAMESLITQQTDTQYAYNEATYARIFNGMLKGDNVVGTKWNGTQKYTKIPTKLKNNLARQGIDVVGSGSSKYLTFKGEVINASDFSNVYRNNLEFREAYTIAKRGRVLGFFDNAANKVYNKLGISRNLFDDYKQTSDAEADMRQFDDTVTDKLDTTGAKTSTRTASEGPEYKLDENGQPIPDGNGGYVTEDVIRSNTDEADVTSKRTKVEAETKAGSFISNIAGNVKQSVNLGCTGVAVGNMIAISVAAATMYRTINVFLSGEENNSKTMAGFGSESAINSYMNRLTTPATISVEDYGNIQYDLNGASADNIDNLKVKLNTVSMSGAATESNGFKNILAGVAPNLKETENYSLEKTIKAVSGAFAPVFGLTTAKDTIKHCAELQMGTAFASIAVSLIPGVGEVYIVSQVLFKVGLTVAATAAISAFLGFLIPTIAETLFRVDFTGLEGLALGEVTMAGSYAANSRLGQEASGQTVGSKEMLAQYNKLSSEAIALENELDGYKRSPFDLTSKNTFLGSIAFSLLPSLTSQHTSSINTLLTSTSNSIASLTNTASALPYNESTFSSYTGSCPMQESIGIDCNMYGYPKIGSDPSIINIPTNDDTYTDLIGNQTICDNEGDCEVNEGSELDKYINLCTYRTSPFGFTDYNILNSLSKGGIIVSALSALPLIGDVLDIFTSQELLDNLPWATGEVCKMASDNPKWEEFKYYQKYIGETRIINGMGGFEDEKEDGNNDGSDKTEETSNAKVNEEHTTVTIPGLKNKYKIAWVSDLHMIADGTDYVDQARYDMFKTPDGVYSAEYLNSIIDHLNNGNFDAVIFGGDMIDYYSTKNYETLRAGLAKLNMPWFYIYGSEDHDKYTGRTNDSVAGDLSSDSAAGSGDIIDLGELKIVGLNNSSNAKIGSSDLNSVANNIQNAGKPVLLATHVPFASKINNDSLKNSISNAHNGQAYYWTDGSSNWELSDNQAMQSFLNDNIYNDDTNVKGVFAGHVHTLSNDTKLTDNINQHIFKGSFGGSIGVIDVVGDNTAQTNIVDYDIPNRDPVLASRERFLEKNPLDNSPAGYLARISGLTKSDATLVLDIAAYYDFVNNYDASTRLAMNGDASDIKTADTVVAEAESQRLLEHPMIGDGESAEEYIILISQTPIYADIRNRSYAA